MPVGPFLVQSTGTTKTLNNVAKGHDLIFVIGSTFQNLGIIVSDNLNGSWGAPIAFASTFGTLNFFVMPNSAAGNVTVSVVMNPTGKPTWSVLMEVSGVALASPLDQKASNNQSGTNSFSVGPTGTLANAVEFVVAAFQGNSSQTWTAGSGYTLLSPATQQFACEYLTNNTSSTSGVTATATTGSNVAVDEIVVAFLPMAMLPEAITSSEGHIGVSASNALTQQSSSFSEGTPTTALANNLAGQSLTFTEGVIVNVIPIGSQTISFSEGVITTAFSGDVTLALSAVTGQFAVGALADNISYILDHNTVVLTGQVLTSTPGVISPALAPTVSAQSGTFVEGTLDVTNLLSFTFPAQTITSLEGPIISMVGANISSSLSSQNITSSMGAQLFSVGYQPPAQTVTTALGNITFSNVSGFVMLGAQTMTLSEGTITAVIPGAYPNLVGMLLDEAVAQLELTGAVVPGAIGYFGTWPVSVKWVPGGRIAPFIVMAQSLGQGTTIVRNGPITLTVSEPDKGVVYP